MKKGFVLFGIMCALVLGSGVSRAEEKPVLLKTKPGVEIRVENNAQFPDLTFYVAYSKEEADIHKASARVELDTNRIDFSKNFVIMGYMGEMRSGGYAISFKDVKRDGDLYNVTVDLQSPAPNSMVTSVITYPSSYVIVDKEKMYERAYPIFGFSDSQGNFLVGQQYRPIIVNLLPNPLVREYVVKKGDTLWKIARVNGFNSVESILNFIGYVVKGNKINNPDKILPGQLLKLPPQNKIESDC